MSQTDLRSLMAEMRARCEAASPDWRIETGFCGSTMRPFLVRPEKDGIQFGASVQDADDLTFAAYARSDLPRALDALEIALRCIQEDADSWDADTRASERGRSDWHKTLSEIQAALKGEANGSAQL